MKGGEQKQKQTGIAQQIDDAKHLNMIGIHALSRHQIDRQVAHQRRPDKNHVNGGIRLDLLGGKQQIPQLLPR